MTTLEPKAESPDERTPDGAAPGASPGGRTFSTSLLVGAIVGIIFVVVFAVALLRRDRGHAGPVASTGAGPATSIGKGTPGNPSLISPIGTVPHTALTLHWTTVQGIEEYEALVYDNMARVLWRSGRMKGESVEVPAQARSLISPGPTHFWRVIGYRSDGSEARSPTVPFTVAK